jgi:hypothetical protein
MKIQGVDITSFMTYILNHTREVIEYDWGLDYSKKVITDVMNRAYEDLRKIDFTQLTMDEAITLGFRQFNSDDENFLLVPLWLYPALPDGIHLRSINNEEVIKGVNDIDNDNRYGLLAYGITITPPEPEIKPEDSIRIDEMEE